MYIYLLFHVNCWRVCHNKNSWYAKFAPSIAQFIWNPCVWGMSCQTLLNIVFGKYCPAHPIATPGNLFSVQIFQFQNVFFSSVLAYRLKHEHFWKEITWWLALRAIIITVLLLNVCVFADVDFPETCFKHFIVSNLKTKSTLLQKWNVWLVVKLHNCFQLLVAGFL